MKLHPTSKRGQVSGLFIGGVGGIIAFGVLVIALSLIGQVLTVQQNTQAEGQTSASTATNESCTVNCTLTNAGTPTLGANIINATAVVTNGSVTSGVLTQHTHWELLATGELTIIDGTETIDAVNVTYDYNVFTETVAYNVTGGGLAGTLAVGGLAPTMGLIFGMIIVLGLLVLLMVFFGPRLLQRQ